MNNSASIETNKKIETEEVNLSKESISSGSYISETTKNYRALAAIFGEEYSQMALDSQLADTINKNFRDLTYNDLPLEGVKAALKEFGETTGCSQEEMQQAINSDIAIEAMGEHLAPLFITGEGSLSLYNGSCELLDDLMKLGMSKESVEKFVNSSKITDAISFRLSIASDIPVEGVSEFESPQEAASVVVSLCEDYGLNPLKIGKTMEELREMAEID